MPDQSPATEHDRRARELHKWFCQETGQELRLTMAVLRRWIDWLMAGHNGPELAKVIRYLKREISRGKRNHGALSLHSLLDIETFEKDLGLASMASSGKLDPERRLAPPPDAAPKPPQARHVAAADQPISYVVTEAGKAALEEIRRLRKELKP
jgi:hypothetical protein